MRVPQASSLSMTLSGFVAIVGLVVMGGWMLQIQSLVQILPGGPPIPFNAALCFALLGLASAGAIHHGHLLLLPVVPAVLVAGIGSTALLQHVVGVDFWLDAAAARAFAEASQAAPGRMAAQTAGLFVAGSLTALAYALESRSLYTVAGASIIAGQGLVAIGGYLLGIDASSGWSSLTLVPLNQAICFTSIGVAYLVVLWDEARLHDPLKPLEWVHVPVAFVVLAVMLSIWHWTVQTLAPMRGMSAAGGEAALVVALVGGVAAAVTVRLSALAYERRVALEHAHGELERTVERLQGALSEIKTLSGLLPICAWCKRVRDDRGYWSQVEDHVSRHTGAEFSHSVCPDCEVVVAEEIADIGRKQGEAALSAAAVGRVSERV